MLKRVGFFLVINRSVSLKDKDGVWFKKEKLEKIVNKEISVLSGCSANLRDEKGVPVNNEMSSKKRLLGEMQIDSIYANTVSIKWYPDITQVLCVAVQERKKRGFSEGSYLVFEAVFYEEDILLDGYVKAIYIRNAHLADEVRDYLTIPNKNYSDSPPGQEIKKRIEAVGPPTTSHFLMHRVQNITNLLAEPVYLAAGIFKEKVTSAPSFMKDLFSSPASRKLSIEQKNPVVESNKMSSSGLTRQDAFRRKKGPPTKSQEEKEKENLSLGTSRPSELQEEIELQEKEVVYRKKL